MNNLELNITRFFKEASPNDYSASQMELGDKAGEITWNHAVEDSLEYLILDNEEKRENFRKFVKGLGAWSDEEIASWSDTELNALLLQSISGDIREAELDTENPDWEEYQEGVNKGLYSGQFSWDEEGNVYYYIGI